MRQDQLLHSGWGLRVLPKAQFFTPPGPGDSTRRKREAWVHQSVIELIAERYPQQHHRLGELTTIEQTTVTGLLDGLTSREIGKLAGVSESSVKGVVQQLFDKAGVRKRSQLVRVALERPHGIGKRRNAGETRTNHPHVSFDWLA